MACESREMVVDEDPTRLQLEVYETKAGLWHPEFGELAQPDGWEFLPAGDAFLTRRVEAAGVYWVLFRPKGRREHRRQLGLLAPAGAIASARAAAAATAARREITRETSIRQRERTEAAYRAEFEAAVTRWLDFAPEHSALARDIARGAVDRAAVVGSGRVGRTKMLSLEDRSALAARAFIRHRYTNYDDRLVGLELIAFDQDIDIDIDIVDVGDYRDIKRTAHGEVDAFLDRHRRS
jgi:Uncharacterized conserved protein (DUF2293)